MKRWLLCLVMMLYANTAFADAAGAWYTGLDENPPRSGWALFLEAGATRPATEWSSTGRLRIVGVPDFRGTTNLGSNFGSMFEASFGYRAGDFIPITGSMGAYGLVRALHTQGLGWVMFAGPVFDYVPDMHLGFAFGSRMSVEFGRVAVVLEVRTVPIQTQSDWLDWSGQLQVLLGNLAVGVAGERRAMRSPERPGRIDIWPTMQVTIGWVK